MQPQLTPVQYMQTSLFVHAHACMLPSLFNVGQHCQLHFRTNIGNCSVNEDIQIDIDPTHYLAETIGPARGPFDKTNDYQLSFYDEYTTPFDFGTMGAFYWDNNQQTWVNLYSHTEQMRYADGSSDKLSTLIPQWWQFGKWQHIYLNMCRQPCQNYGGKRKRKKRQTIKGKPRKNRKTYKRNSRKH